MSGGVAHLQQPKNHLSVLRHQVIARVLSLSGWNTTFQDFDMLSDIYQCHWTVIFVSCNRWMVTSWGCESQSQHSFPSRTCAKTIWYVLVLLVLPQFTWREGIWQYICHNLVWFNLYSAIAYTCFNRMTAVIEILNFNWAKFYMMNFLMANTMQTLLQNGVCEQGDYISMCTNALLSWPLIAVCGKGETKT